MTNLINYTERFWSKVNKTEGCWLWTGSRRPPTSTSPGYAKFWLNRKFRLAHRVAYELTYGPIPAGLTIDHVRARGCTNRHCVNPAHLEAVTTRVNTQRGGDSLKTHCPKGHPYNEENTRVYRARRNCRACDRLRYWV